MFQDYCIVMEKKSLHRHSQKGIHNNVFIILTERLQWYRTVLLKEIIEKQHIERCFSNFELYFFRFDCLFVIIRSYFTVIVNIGAVTI